MTVVVRRSCASSDPSSLVALRCLTAASGLPCDSIDFSSDPLLSSDDNGGGIVSVELRVESSNPFLSTSNSSSYVVRGWTSVARTICNVVPECGLWGSGPDSKRGDVDRVEGWIESATGALVGIAHGLDEDRVKDPHFRSQVEEYAASLERHLAKRRSEDANSPRCLVGETLTAADVAVSVLLSSAAARTGAKIIGGPDETATDEWLKTVLTNDVVGGVLGKTFVLPWDDDDDSPSCVPPVLEEEEGTAAGAVPSSFDDNPVVLKLKELSIPSRTYGHVLCTSAEELVSNVSLPSDTETHTKNLLLRDKKHGLFLVTVRPDAEVNTKALGKALKLEGKVNLRLADESILTEKLGCKRGCVGPLSVMNDADSDVTLVLDEGLTTAAVERVHSHPLRNDASTAMTPKDLMKFVETVGHAPVVLPFDRKGGGEKAEKDKEKWAGKAPSSRPPDKKHEKPKAPPPAAKGDKKKVDANKKSSKKGETLLALQWKKSENFAMWYSDVIVLSEMISYYDISGCYVLRPWSYKIWEYVQEWFNPMIRALGVENSYFPLFVSQDRLEKEKDHVEGFAPEVAWVTKSGSDELAKPIAVRPTSETIMYPAFSDWIKSHRDLPLKLNQWSNVVRWEFKDPTPFLRSREFLWQEGHTAHVDHDDADKMVMQALELYRGVYEDLLAVPVIKGYKTEKEKFAGGHRTTTVEAYIPTSGRAIQGATSHDLGQNFGKMFDITFQDVDGKSKTAWQTSWGLTTRTIGVMIMVHGDDRGLVLPPKVSPIQAVVVPIVSKKLTSEVADPYCEGILKSLVERGIRAKYDDRAAYNPGWKYAHWEQKGVPIRIEVGPRDIDQKSARVVVRHSGEKIDVSVDDIAESVFGRLDEIQTSLFEKAKKERDEHLVRVTEWKDFVPNLERNNLVLTPWCGGGHQDWEEWVKEKSREESLKVRGEEGEDERAATSVAAKTLCIPFEQPELPEGTKCIASGMDATCWVLWGRSY